MGEYPKQLPNYVLLTFHFFLNNDGTSSRMHASDHLSGKMYIETSYKDGSKSRQIGEKNGDILMEEFDRMEREQQKTLNKKMV
jgi:hypothetical protein